MYSADTGVPSSCVSMVFLSVEPGRDWKQNSQSQVEGLFSYLVAKQKTNFGALLTHRPISDVVLPGSSIHAVLDLKLGDPVVALRTPLDDNPCYLPGLSEVHLDPARGC